MSDVCLHGLVGVHCDKCLLNAMAETVHNLQEKVFDLEAEVASHARYRELVKSDLAEKSWVKHAKDLEKERDMWKSEAALTKYNYESISSIGDERIRYLEKQLSLFMQFHDDIVGGTTFGGVFYREEALEKLAKALK